MEEFDWDADCGHGGLGRRVVLTLLRTFGGVSSAVGKLFRVSDFHAKVRFLDFDQINGCLINSVATRTTTKLT